MSGTFILALVSLIATVGYLSIFVALHVLPTGYNPIRHAVSDHAIGKYGYLFRIGLWVGSLGIVTLGAALIIGVGVPPLAVRSLVFLFLIPAARIGMARFPTDLEGDKLSPTGIAQYVLAIGAFNFTYLVISEITSLLGDLSNVQWITTLLSWTAAIVAPALALVVVTMIPALRRVFGLFERVFLVTTNVWFALAALILIVRSML